jgi:hypothetical protein
MVHAHRPHGERPGQACPDRGRWLPHDVVESSGHSWSSIGTAVQRSSAGRGQLAVVAHQSGPGVEVAAGGLGDHDADGAGEALDDRATMRVSMVGLSAHSVEVTMSAMTPTRAGGDGRTGRTAARR